MPTLPLRVIAPATLAVLCLAVFAACGGGDDDSGLSKSQYIERADALCKPAPRAPKTQDPKAIARHFRRTLIPFRERTAANLRKLEPNADLQPKVDRFLSATDQVTALFRRQAAALERNDLIESGNLDVAIAQGQAKRNKAAAEVGYRKCGQPTQGPPVSASGFESQAVLTRADAACKRATDRILATEPKDFEPATLAETTAETLPAQKQALDVLRELRSQATKPAYARFVAIEERRYAQAQRIVAAGRANRRAEFDRLQEEDQRIYQQGYPIALRLGFTVCGVSSPVGF